MVSGSTEVSSYREPKVLDLRKKVFHRVDCRKVSLFRVWGSFFFIFIYILLFNLAVVVEAVDLWKDLLYSAKPPFFA